MTQSNVRLRDTSKQQREVCLNRATSHEAELKCYFLQCMMYLTMTQQYAEYEGVCCIDIYKIHIIQIKTFSGNNEHALQFTSL